MVRYRKYSITNEGQNLRRTKRNKEWKERNIDPFNGGPDQSPGEWELFRGRFPPTWEPYLYYGERDYWPRNVILPGGQIKHVLERFRCSPDVPHKISLENIRRFARNFDSEGYAVDPSITANLGWDALPVKHEGILDRFRIELEDVCAEGSGTENEDGPRNAEADETAPANAENPTNERVPRKTPEPRPVASFHATPTASGPSMLKKRLAESAGLRKEAKRLRQDNRQHEAIIESQDEEIAKLKTDMEKLKADMEELRNKNWALKRESKKHERFGQMKEKVLAELLSSFQSLYDEAAGEGDEQDKFLENIKAELGRDVFDELLALGRAQANSS
ncbi:hypothetical protein IWZ01DRAFT_318597 [Phyllosticta capitalensis]